MQAYTVLFVCAGLWEAIDTVQAEVAAATADALTAAGTTGGADGSAGTLLSLWRPDLRPKKGLLYGYCRSSPQCAEVFSQLTSVPRVRFTSVSLCLFRCSHRHFALPRVLREVLLCWRLR